MAVLEDAIEHITIFALTWSYCCTVNTEGRVKLNSLVRKIIEEKVPHIALPKEGNIYNYRYCMEEKTYLPW